MSSLNPKDIEEALVNSELDYVPGVLESVRNPLDSSYVEPEFNLAGNDPVDLVHWPKRKRQFARELLIYSHSKDLVPEVLPMSLLDHYYQQLAEDDSNKGELIAALWTEAVAL